MNLKEKKQSSKNVFQGKLLNVFQDTVKCPDNSIATREYIQHCNAVCILPFLNNGNILLEKQYRYPFDEILYELPAGKIDKNENKENAAIRELEEETGYHANTLEYLGCIYPSCAYTNEIIYLYVAKDLVKTKQHLDENEFIEILEISLNEFNDFVKSNKLKDAKSICALQFYFSKMYNNKGEVK